MGLSISPAMCPPKFTDGGVAEEGGSASRGDQVWGGTALAGTMVPSALLWEGCCRVMLTLTSVPGILTIMKRMITEPSCRRW